MDETDQSVLPAPRLGTVHALGSPNPLRFGDRRLTDITHGATVAEILREIEIEPTPGVYRVQVFIDGLRVPESEWDTMRPDPGTTMLAQVVPMGGGRGKAILSIVLGIGLAAFGGVALIGGALGRAASFGAVAASFLASGTKSLLAPPPTLPFEGDIPTSEESPALVGRGNAARPYSPVARQYGQYLRFPTYAAKPYTETVGNDSYLRLLFDFGYGPLDLTDLKIGETAIADFDVDYNVHQGYDDDAALSIFTQGVDEDSFGLAMEDGDPASVRTTALDTHEASLDIVFPLGLICFRESDGAPSWVLIDFTIEYREAGTSDPWTGVTAKGELGPGIENPSAGDFTFKGKVRGGITRGIAWDFPSADQYEVRVSRDSTSYATSEPEPNSKAEDASWTVLRSIRPGTKPLVPNLCLVEMRIKSTDQLNGAIDNFNAMATSILPIWSDAEPLNDGWGPDNRASTNLSLASTRNAAWAFAENLRGKQNRRPVANAKIDPFSIAAWAETNEDESRNFDAVVDFDATVGQVARDIASSCRASPTLIDGKYGVVVDEPDPTVVTHLTARDVHNFRSTKVFAREVHALRVGYVEPVNSYQPNERVVYADGYDENTATLFDRIDLWGVADNDRAFRDARYHMAAKLLRPEVYSFEMGVQALQITRGDRFRFTHDVLLVGVATGRVKQVFYAGDNLTALVLDESFTLDILQEHGVRIRTASGESLVTQIVPLPGELPNVVIHPWLVGIDTSSMTTPPAVGDVATVGLLGNETGDYKVHAIYPKPDLSARVEFVDYSPAIFTADTEAIPPFDPNITQPLSPPLQTPARPTIDTIASDESVLIINADGTTTPRILISISTPPGALIPTEYLQAQYRENVSGEWLMAPPVDARTRQIGITGVDEGSTYDLRVRGTSGDGRASEWTSIQTHTVIGSSTPPADVSGLRREPGSMLVWDYPDPPRDHAGFIVKHQAGSDSNWLTGIPAHDGLVTESQFDASLIPGGQRTFMVKSVDSSGNESVNAGVLVADIGGPPVENIVESKDFHALGFTGTIVDGTVEGITGDLVADTTIAQFWRADASTFWRVNPTDPFWDQAVELMTYEDSWAPLAASLPGRLQVDLDVTAEAWRLEYRVSGSSTWLRWPGYIDAENVTYEFLLTTEAGGSESRIEAFAVLIDKPDIEDRIEDFVVAATGTVKVTPTITFKAIKQVIATLQDDGNDGRSFVVVDKSDEVNGPEVEVYDDASTRVAGLADVVLRGY